MHAGSVVGHSRHTVQRLQNCVVHRLLFSCLMATVRLVLASFIIPPLAVSLQADASALLYTLDPYISKHVPFRILDVFICVQHTYATVKIFTYLCEFQLYISECTVFRITVKLGLSYETQYQRTETKKNYIPIITVSVVTLCTLMYINVR